MLLRKVLDLFYIEFELLQKELSHKIAFQNCCNWQLIMLVCNFIPCGMEEKKLSLVMKWGSMCT